MVARFDKGLWLRVPAHTRTHYVYMHTQVHTHTYARGLFNYFLPFILQFWGSQDLQVSRCEAFAIATRTPGHIPWHAMRGGFIDASNPHRHPTPSMPCCPRMSGARDCARTLSEASASAVRTVAI